MSAVMTRAEYRAALQEHEQELTAHLESTNLQALPTVTQLKEWYDAVRPILVVVQHFPLLPAKARVIVTGFLSAADAAFTAVI